MNIRFGRALRYPALIAVVAFVLPAVAGPRARVVYRAADGCPTEDEFATKVATHGGNFASVEGGQIMNVTIERGADGYSGSLRIASGDTTSNPRDVHAAGCADVADALAVVTALALRGNDAAESAVDNPGVSTKNVVKETTTDVPAGQVRLRSAIPITAWAGVEVGMLPSVLLPRYDLSASIANFVTTHEKTRLFNPIVRIRGSFFGPGTYRSNDTSTVMTGWSAGLAACLTPIYNATRGLALFFCGEYSLGEVGLKTKNAVGIETQSKSQALGIATVEAEAQYNISDHLQIGLKVGADASTERITAERPNGSEIFHSPPVSGHGALGVGVHF